MLNLNQIDAGYGPAQVLADISFEVPAGSAVALMGRNGAGKSTTLKTVMGLISPMAGKVMLNGQDITGLKPDAVARAGVGYVPEDRRVFAGLSVRENLITGARPDSAGTWTEARLFDLFPEIARRRNAPAGTLSGGERQMLSIARALMGNPQLMLMDEPSEGLAPVVVDRLGAALSAIRDEGVTVLLAEQNRRLAARLAEQAVVMDQGRIAHRGPMAELMHDDQLTQRLLGV